MRFQKVYIEISDYCALACAFCPSATRKHRRGEMDIELFWRICEQIKGRVERVCLHILGDPLSVRNLDCYVEILKQHALDIELVSTGLFLRQRHFELLLAAPFVQVAFSLSAHLANPAHFTALHIQRILSFAHTNLMRHSPLFVNLRIHHADIAAQTQGYMQLLTHIAGHFDLCALSLHSLLMRGERVRLGNKVFLNPMRSFTWHSSHKHDKVHCYGANKQIGILSNGEIVPCCMDYLGRASFGNVAHSSLQSILDSKSFIAFAQSLREGAKPPSALCAQCGFIKES